MADLIYEQCPRMAQVAHVGLILVLTMLVAVREKYLHVLEVPACTSVPIPIVTPYIGD